MQAMTQLEAINSILRAAGEAPVNSLEAGGVELALALASLEESSRSIQSKGWSFNRFESVEFSPDSVTGEIVLPINVIAVDGPRDTHYMIRDRHLYDLSIRSKVFEDTVELDYTEILSWDDLPQHAKEFIMRRAALEFVDSTSDNPSRKRQAKARDMEAEARFNAVENTTEDANFLDNIRYTDRDTHLI